MSKTKASKDVTNTHLAVNNIVEFTESDVEKRILFEKARCASQDLKRLSASNPYSLLAYLKQTKVTTPLTDDVLSEIESKPLTQSQLQILSTILVPVHQLVIDVIKPELFGLIFAAYSVEHTYATALDRYPEQKDDALYKLVETASFYLRSALQGLMLAEEAETQQDCFIIFGRGVVEYKIDYRARCVASSLEILVMIKGLDPSMISKQQLMEYYDSILIFLTSNVSADMEPDYRTSIYKSLSQLAIQLVEPVSAVKFECYVELQKHIVQACDDGKRARFIDKIELISTIFNRLEIAPEEVQASGYAILQRQLKKSELPTQKILQWVLDNILDVSLPITTPASISLS